MRTQTQLLLSAAVCLMVSGQPQAAPSPQTKLQFHLEAQPLSDAVTAWAKQAGLQLIWPTGSLPVVSHQAPKVSGLFSPDEALSLLLTGTGLTYSFVDPQTVAIRPVSTVSISNGVERINLVTVSPSPGGGGATSVQDATPSTMTDDSEASKPVVDEVIVTGSHIRGVQPSSPLVAITQEEMRLSGQSNLGEVMRSIPQNFSGGQNPGVQSGAGGAVANQNITGSSGLNLRGLGPDATLTLLNGARLAYDAYSQATDVASIPIAAIDRVEVLLDGASAIYGSDAVGGVANIILKRNFDGANVTAKYGQATDGGYEHNQISAVAGKTWSSGGFLVAGETATNSRLLGNQREYLSYITRGDLLFVYPKISQDGGLITGHQSIGSHTDVALDAFYTKRSMYSSDLATPILATGRTDTTIYGISPSIQISLANDWSLRAHGFIGEDEADAVGRAYLIGAGNPLQEARIQYSNRGESAGLEFEGAVLALPAGAVRLSFGGGTRRTEFEQSDRITGITQVGGSNTSNYGFGEMYLPIVNQGQGVPLVNDLSFSGAFRYEDYDKFGETTTPKFGLAWKVLPTVSVRASWGKSFKAPTALQQFRAGAAQLRTAASLGIAGVPSTATVLTTTGGNLNLTPERAEIVTAGVVITPSFLPRASIELGWFDIDYSQRVVVPIEAPVSQYGQVLANPAFSDFVYLNPTQGLQEEVLGRVSTFSNLTPSAYDPQRVVAIIRNNYFNAAAQKSRGVDLSVKYAVPAFGGMWSFNGGGSWITDGDRRIVELAPAFDTVGVVAYPPKFKARAATSWARAGFSGSLIANHIGSVKNTRVTPSVAGASMTTIDFVFDVSAEEERWSGVGLNLAIMNAFDKRPPFLQPVQPYYVNYDSTNYSALGRIISLSITKIF